MEVLVFLLIGILFAFSGNSKKKRGQQGGVANVPRPQQSGHSAALKRAANPAKGRDFMKELMNAVGDATENMLEGKPAPKRAVELSPEERESVRQALLARRAERQAAVEATLATAQGASAQDDEGCVGGSLAHAHTEGETQAEHRQHVERLKKREAEERRAEEALWDAANLNRQRLRQAVVMAEVLGKPVALRTRGYGRRAT